MAYTLKDHDNDYDDDIKELTDPPSTEPEGSLCSQQPAISTYLSQKNPLHNLSVYFSVRNVSDVCDVFSWRNAIACGNVFGILLCYKIFHSMSWLFFITYQLFFSTVCCTLKMAFVQLPHFLKPHCSSSNPFSVKVYVLLCLHVLQVETLGLHSHHMHSLALSYVCLLRDLFYIPILMTRQSI